jgi:hypothetical protein
LGAFKYIN